MKTIRIHFIVWLFFAVTFVLPLLARADDDANIPSPEPLSMAEAIHIAAEQNPEIKAAQFQVDAVQSNAVKAQSGFYPQLNFTQSFNRTTNPMWAFGTKLNQAAITQGDFDPSRLNDPDAIDNFVSTFLFSWSIYEGGRTKIGWQQAKQNLSIASLALERTRQHVIAKTAAAYVGLVLSQKNIMVIKQALETATANLKMIQSRYDSGFVVKSDLLRAKVRIADLEQQHLQAKSRFKITEAVLNAAMGSGEATPINPVTPLKISSEIQGTVDTWIDTALSIRPEMETLRLEKDIAEKEISKSQSGHYPDINLVGNFEINTEDFSDSADNYTLGAVVRVNIFSGNRISGETKAAKSMLSRIQEMQKGMALGIKVQTREAFLKAKSARDRIRVVNIAVDQAEEGLRIVKNRYKNGLITMVTLLDAEEARQQAHTNYFRALHDYKVARVELELAAGTIDSEFH